MAMERECYASATGYLIYGEHANLNANASEYQGGFEARMNDILDVLG